MASSLQISGSVRFVSVLGFNRSRYFRPIGSLGFSNFGQRCSIGRPLRSSFSGDKFGGSVESNGDEKGFILDAERDGSGSVLGFQLIPPGDQEISSTSTQENQVEVLAMLVEDLERVL